MLQTILSFQGRSYNYQQDEWYEQILYSIADLSWLYYVIFLLLIYFLLKRTRKEFHSHWNTLIDDFEFSTESFYKHLKKELLSHGISGISSKSVSLPEGNFFSSRRRYLRILWKDYQYDICAAPFGDGFFVSWWLKYKTSIGQILINLIPFIGGWLVRKIFPITYYKIDTASMFQTYCHQSVLKVIDDITRDTRVRVMTEDERKPILKDIFKR